MTSHSGQRFGTVSKAPCNDFNDRSCNGSVCNFDHKCSRCSSYEHPTSACIALLPVQNRNQAPTARLFQVPPGRAPWTQKIDLKFPFSFPQEPNIASGDLRTLVSSARPGPNYITKSAHIESNLNFEAWKKYSDIISLTDPTLIDQLMWGFPTRVTDPSSLSVPFTNHTSARENPRVVQDYRLKHLDTKALYGPFDTNSLDVPIIVSPLQVAFSSLGKARVCNDLSYGAVSVNSQISDN